MIVEYLLVIYLIGSTLSGLYCSTEEVKRRSEGDYPCPVFWWLTVLAYSWLGLALVKFVLPPDVENPTWRWRK